MAPNHIGGRMPPGLVGVTVIIINEAVDNGIS